MRPEGFADVARAGNGVRLAVGAFGVDVDEAHLHGGERSVELAVGLVGGLVAIAAEPGVLGAPEDVFLRDPDVGAATGEAERS